MKKKRIYAAIDLKSFYASVECRERGLDPLAVNLVVADRSRTEKTICLAVSPSLKKIGLSGRARLFEVEESVRAHNILRQKKAGRALSGASYFVEDLENNPLLALDFIAAPPRMALYLSYSARIYQIYLRHVAPEDIHVYSIDEVFMDLTDYLHSAERSASEMVTGILQEVFRETGITATAGVGTNLYLAKVAMDILAKHAEPDAHGARIAELDEQLYRKVLWTHRPLTDFWRVGHGYAAKLEKQGLYTMGDIARCSVGKAGEYYNEDLLYRMFGVNAELLIDHAWGYEPCTLAQIKAYRPKLRSSCSGQVLQEPYTFEKARLVVREMADTMALDLVDKGEVTDQLVLTIGYDVENLRGVRGNRGYAGEIKTDRYGRKVPKHAHGTAHLPQATASSRLITGAAVSLYDRITDRKLLIRRISITAGHLEQEGENGGGIYRQLSLFPGEEKTEQFLEKEKKVQQAALAIRKKYGKNAVLKGMNLQEGATAISRNLQIGGHRA